jgi:hypothetical protein
MYVEQCIITRINGVDTITDRIQLECELVAADIRPNFDQIRILEAGAGLSIGDIINAPKNKITA